MLALKSPDWVCNSWPVDASTRIVELTPASSREPLIVVVRDAFTSTLETLSSAKPAFLIKMVYLPGKRASMRYEPVESVSTMRGWPTGSSLVETDSTGSYRIEALLPGRYTILIKMVYLPGKRASMRYEPVESVSTMRGWPPRSTHRRN